MKKMKGRKKGTSHKTRKIIWNETNETGILPINHKFKPKTSLLSNILHSMCIAGYTLDVCNTQQSHKQSQNNSKQLKEPYN